MGTEVNTDAIIRAAFKGRGGWDNLAITSMDQAGFYLVRVNDESALRHVDGQMRACGVVVAVTPEKEAAARNPVDLWTAEAERAAEIVWTLIDWRDHPEKAKDYARSYGSR